MMRTLTQWLLLGSLLFSVGSQAANSVQVVGLFPDAAVLLVDGQRKLVRAGQVGPGGVEVLSADASGAVLRVNGVQQRYELSREYSQGVEAFAPSQGRAQVSIARGAGGHYWTAGSVNGQTVQFLVDTGASSIAMNSAQAGMLNIDYRVEGQPIQVSTASGQAKAWRVRLDSVKIGALTVLGVDAVVLEGSSPREALLGMSFLNNVRWREDQGLLILESKL